MARVYSKRKGAEKPPPGAVYVGRPSPWGNPFEIGLDGTREEVVAKHRAAIESDPAAKRRAVRELRGKDLVCWCKSTPDDPTPCHAETLVRIANGD